MAESADGFHEQPDCARRCACDDCLSPRSCGFEWAERDRTRSISMDANPGIDRTTAILPRLCAASSEAEDRLARSGASACLPDRIVPFRTAGAAMTGGVRGSSPRIGKGVRRRWQRPHKHRDRIRDRRAVAPIGAWTPRWLWRMNLSGLPAPAARTQGPDRGDGACNGCAHRYRGGRAERDEKG
jgi:hypothetical protein